MDEKKFYTYLLLTENNTYYCGYTDDMEKRYKKHLDGTGAKYTKANKPVKIAYLAAFNTKSEAMKEECRIKKLSRADKDKLVSSQIP
ncbi:GIY-YIG nuclease family protein [bacterium]|nr:GIY-YIG nuclease family protein [bacterium]